MAESNSDGASKVLKRYGPIAIVGVLVIVAIVALGSGGDDNEDNPDTTEPSGAASGLPLTFQEAEAEGRDDIAWGEGCDTDEGRMAIPLRNAAPCIEPWDEAEDNGGATSPGVTADAIKIVVYQGEPDPLQQVLVSDAGGDVDPAVTAQTVVDYLTMLGDVYETYGRALDVQIVEASGLPDDATAAQADARTIIDLEPFAVVGGPASAPVYWQEITAAGILCMGSCSTAEGWDVVEGAAPYLWPTGHAPEQADVQLAELIGTQLAGKPAEFAGDPELQDADRVFGYVQAETETGEYTARNDAFDALLLSEYDIDIATRSTYLFDVARGQETATAVVARMRDAGVTTVILSVDPLIPARITAEATKQGYFPEWIVGPSVLADTTFFGRTFDQEQWAHAFGISLPAARADADLSDAFFSYQWYFGEEVPVNTANVLLPGPAQLLLGIHLAGPELTPDTFAQGLFRYPPIAGGKTFGHVSWGDDLWGRTDYNSTDDVAVFWWDAEATGEDETGNEGTGMMRYVDGGARYLPGEWPTEPLALFDEEGSVTVYDELPEGEEPPDYPEWPGSPAAG